MDRQQGCPDRACITSDGRLLDLGAHKTRQVMVREIVSGQFNNAAAHIFRHRPVDQDCLDLDHRGNGGRGDGKVARGRIDPWRKPMLERRLVVDLLAKPFWVDPLRPKRIFERVE